MTFSPHHNDLETLLERLQGNPPTAEDLLTLSNSSAKLWVNRILKLPPGKGPFRDRLAQHFNISLGSSGARSPRTNPAAAPAPARHLPCLRPYPRRWRPGALLKYPTWKAFGLQIFCAVAFTLLIFVSWFFLLTLISEEQYGIRNAVWAAVSARTTLFSIPHSERNFLWDVAESSLRYLLDLPLFIISNDGNFLSYYHHLQIATGGLPAPHQDGYVLFSHREVSQILMDLQQERGQYVNALPVPSSCMSPDTLIFLSNGPRHSRIRQLILDNLPGFNLSLTSPEARQKIINLHANETIEDLEEALILQLIPTLFFRMFGSVLTRQEVDTFHQYLTYGISCAVGTGLEKATFGYFTSKVHDIRLAALDAVKRSPVGKAMWDRAHELEIIQCLDPPLDPETLLLQVVDGYLFAGLFGTTQLLTDTIDRIRSQPVFYPDLFRQNPKAFIIEQARLSPPVTSVTAVSTEAVDIRVGEGHVGNVGQWVDGGKLVHFPKGTPVELALTTANRDPSVFGPTADDFDPKRPNLHQMISWNGLQDMVAHGAAPRGCPGYHLSIDLVRLFVEDFLQRNPSIPPSQEHAPGDCYHEMTCLTVAERAKAILYDRLSTPVSWYEVLFATVWLSQCVYIMARKTRETPISSIWWTALLCTIFLLIGVLVDSALVAHIALICLSACIATVGILMITQRSLLAGLVLSLQQLFIAFIMSTALVATDFSLGYYFHENALKFSATYFISAVIFLKLTIIIMFPKVGRFKEYFLSLAFALASIPLGLIPKVGLLLSCVCGAAYLYFMAKVIGAISYRCPQGVTLSTLHFRLGDIPKIIIRILIGLLVIVGLLFAFHSFTSYSNGNICGLNDPESSPHCLTSKVTQLDLHTKFLYRMVREDVDADIMDGTPPSTEVFIPIRRVKLPSIEALPSPWYLPNEDEDMMHASTLDKIVDYLTNLFLRSPFFFPIYDMDIHFDDPIQGRDTLRLASGALANESSLLNQTTDDAITRWSFYGIGAHLIRRVPPRTLQTTIIPRPQDVYTVDLLWMSELEVREGFEHYGAAAFFGEDLKVTRIVLSQRGNPIDVFPGDEQWEHAKFVWRSSLFTGITLNHHLSQTHLKFSSIVTQALREGLPPSHPLRRLLTPFSYGTIEINRGAAVYLCPIRGILHRATALTVRGLMDGFEASLSCPYRRPLEILIENKLEDVVPFVRDAIDYAKIVRKFVTDYLLIYYPTDASLYQDPFLSLFARQIESAGMTLPDIHTREDLIELLVEFINTATAYHRHVGHVNEYVLDPAAATGKIRPNNNMADVQASMQIMAIALLTSYPQPKLLGDFKHLLLRDQHFNATSQIFDDFQQDLAEFALEIDRRNEDRPFPIDAFNPRVLLAGVSI